MADLPPATWGYLALAGERVCRRHAAPEREFTHVRHWGLNRKLRRACANSQLSHGESAANTHARAERVTD